MEEKIKKAVENKKLSLNKLGERRWRKYYISVNELVWSRPVLKKYL